LSYSREDRALAVQLQARLQSFAKPWYRLRRLNVFRDESHLVGSALLGSIQAALDRASWLILLASPASTASEWVARELDYWFEKSPQRPVLLVVANGDIAWDARSNDFDWEVSRALPRTLRARFSAEPRWLDLRGMAGEQTLEQRAKLEGVVADIACSILDLPKDQLVGEDARQHRQLLLLRNLAIAALALLAIAASTASVIAYRENRESQRRLNSAFEMGVNSLGSIEQLRNLPGAAKVREQLSEGNQRLLRELAPDLSRTDVRLISREARNAVFDAEERMSKGELQAAANLLDQAKRIYVAHPNDYWALYGASDVFDRLGRLAGMQGNQDLMGSSLENALRYAKLANDKQPSDDALGGIEVSLDNLGTHYQQVGKLEEAAKRHEQALAIAEQLFRKHPSIELRNDLTQSYLILYDLSQRRHHPDAAWLQKATRTLPRPDDPEAPQMAATRVQLAIRFAQSDQGTPEEQAHGCEDALAVTKSMTEADPTAASLQLLAARALLACNAYAVHSHATVEASNYRSLAEKRLEAIVALHPEYGEAAKLLAEVRGLSAGKP